MRQFCVRWTSSIYDYDSYIFLLILVASDALQLVTGDIASSGGKVVVIQNPKIPIFYNLFVKSEADIRRVKNLVAEQLALARQKHPVFVHSIGTPMSIPNTTRIAHHKKANEGVTLLSL